MGRRRRSRSPAAAAPASPAPPQPAQRTGSALSTRIGDLVEHRPVGIAAALVALHIVLALITFLPQPHTGGDNAAYVTLARSLLQHGTYTELWDPALPPHTKYPPAFPVILAGAIALGLGTWVRLKLVVLALSAAAVAGSFYWVRARGGRGLALGVGAVLAVAPGVLEQGRWLLSDVPFWTFTMIALWAFERSSPHEWRRFAVGALAVLLAYFTRSAGLPLLVACLTWLAWRRGWRQLAVLGAVVVIPAALWWLRGRMFGPAGYASEFWLVDPYAPALGRVGFAGLIDRVIENGDKYVTIHLPILLTAATGSGAVLVSAATFIAALAGWVRRIRAPGVAELFTVFYLALILVWPAVWSGERFLLPLLPLLLYYAGDTVLLGIRRLLPSHTWAAGLAAVMLLLGLALPGVAAATEAGRECSARYRGGDRYPCLGPVWTEFFRLAERAPALLPDDAIVLNRKPRLFYALGRVRGSIYPFDPAPAAFFATADSVGARYLVYDRLGGTADAYLRPVLLQSPGAFCIMRIEEQSGTILFGIRAEGREPLAGAAAEPSFGLCDSTYWRSETVMESQGLP